MSPSAIAPSSGGSSRESLLERRVLSMWPRFDRAAIRRVGHDPRRVAALVGQRTSMPEESILRLLTMPSLTDDEAGTWFG